jgi:hypothetical protein
MEYSKDEKIYNIIVEDGNCLTDDSIACYEDQVTEIDHSTFKFTGTLQEFGECLQEGEFLQTDIKESIQEWSSKMSSSDIDNYFGYLSGKHCDSICYYLEEHAKEIEDWRNK